MQSRAPWRTSRDCFTRAGSVGCPYLVHIQPQLLEIAQLPGGGREHAVEKVIREVKLSAWQGGREAGRQGGWFARDGHGPEHGRCSIKLLRRYYPKKQKR